MKNTIHPFRSLAFALIVAVLAAGCVEEAESPLEPQLTRVSSAGGARAFTVYTQNVYLGGDTGPLFSLDFSDLPAVLGATNVFWAQVESSAAAERTSGIVDQIARYRPHVVSLQEAFRFVLLDGAGQPIGGLDLLTLIEDDIAARGLPYEVAVVQEATSSTLPLAFDPSVGVTRWLNFTDRIAVLRRTDVSVGSTASSLYAARLPLGPLDVVRGWARLTVDFGGRTHHVIATHLETQAILPVHSAQADELQNAVVAGLDGVTVIAGDLNSDAAGVPGDPSWTPTYGNLIEAGFVDAWAESPSRRNDDGYTCCYAPDLSDAVALDERIDFVLVRTDEPADDVRAHRGPNGGDRMGRHHRGRGPDFLSRVLGTRRADLTPSGLRQSDHAGLVTWMRASRGLR